MLSMCAAPDLWHFSTRNPVTSESSIWDVNHPEGPTFDQIIDTREGTWMNVDVSMENRSLLTSLEIFT